MKIISKVISTKSELMYSYSWHFYIYQALLLSYFLLLGEEVQLQLIRTLYMEV